MFSTNTTCTSDGTSKDEAWWQASLRAAHADVGAAAASAAASEAAGGVASPAAGGGGSGGLGGGGSGLTIEPRGRRSAD